MDNNIKNIIKYGLLTIIPLIIGTLSLLIYDFYVDILKKIDTATSYIENHNVKQLIKKEEKSNYKNIQRLSYLKYVHNNNQTNDQNSTVYLIEIVRIGHCKYIIVSKKDQSLAVVHAYDCDWEGHKN